MRARLHEVSEEELVRGKAIEDWLSTYSSESGRRSMLSSLRAIVRATYGWDRDAPVRVAGFEWELLADSDFFCVVRDRLVGRYGRQSAPKYIVAMRSLLSSLAKSGLADYTSARRTLEVTKVRVLSNEPEALRFTTEDVWRILRQCRNDRNVVKGHRDLALISLAASTGARRSELVRVHVAHIDLVRREVQLIVKGGGKRTASFHPATRDHVQQWLEYRGDGSGPLLPSLRRGGHIQDTPISDHQFWKLLKSRCNEVGLDSSIAPHDLRRWFVSSLLDSGVDVFTASRVIGHRNLGTTFRYDRRPQERLRAVVDKLDLPGLSELDESLEEGNAANE